MKNKILNLVLALALTLSGLAGTNNIVLAKSQTASWDVTYTGSKLESTYDVSKSTITNMMPGDEITYSVGYKNDSGKAVDFYLSTDIINSLEDKSADGADSSAASGGAYSYKISNLIDGQEKVIYDSEVLGGESAVKGLNQVKNSLEDGKAAYIGLGQIANGNQGIIKVDIKLDGNSQDNSYMYTLATLDVRFGVEEVKTSSNNTKVVDEVITRDVVYTLPGDQQVVVIDDPNIPLDGGPVAGIGGSPVTGDSLVPIIGCTVGLLVGTMLIGCYFIVVKKNREEVA
ncbi:hypothetical protein SAMN02910384_02030 [Pseudobutyrivibrio sp. ACV-2]|uniref:hypothetical protein n=1 Tax=Pseudobutyrivibrio sp. ACV-2 TaxID=1520801 RepID=UPI00089985CB|nr:hypothetical protein [Pseudobutyrivibrio sp. ACV-2]SEA66124.1 hypothetical protein SAMN02910384_02030 [Pseudobutyrivibrio sp. ACV-2]